MLVLGYDNIPPEDKIRLNTANSNSFCWFESLEDEKKLIIASSMIKQSVSLKNKVLEINDPLLKYFRTHSNFKKFISNATTFVNPPNTKVTKTFAL